MTIRLHSSPAELELGSELGNNPELLYLAMYLMYLAMCSRNNKPGGDKDDGILGWISCLLSL